MTHPEIQKLRLAHQHLTPPFFQTPAEVVAALGAVQAQDYAGATWALAQRMGASTTAAALDDAFNNGEILRTHILRPTWHFVTPADIHWLLQLSAPRVNAVNAYMYRQVGIDDATIKKSNAVLTKALQGGRHKTRAELGTALEKAGVSTANGMRLGYLVHRAELDGIVISGPRKGKQFTYALLSERAPHAKTLTRDEALCELTKRYFAGHGPATTADFVWWSGLTATDAKKGIAEIDALLYHEIINGETYWFTQTVSAPKNAQRFSYLLPNYDEYIVGYTDRSAILDAVEQNKLDSRGNVLFNNTIVTNGKVIGTWKRTLKKTGVTLDLNPFAPLTDAQTKSVAAAAKRYGEFLGLPVVIASKRDT